MLNWLFRIFIRDHQNTGDPNVRERYGVFSSLLGALCNLLLFVAKYIVGTLSNSIAIIADSFNNLTDLGSSVVTLVGFKIAASPADEEHPFGHGRAEYISGMVVSFLILLVGFELGKSSVAKILHPEPVVFRWLTVAILAMTICAKLWMMFYNRKIAKLICSPTIAAIAADGRNDSLATAATLLSLFASTLTTLPVDGITGVLVSAFILYSGFGTLKDTVGALLGESPDKGLVRQIQDTILAFPGVVGIHDFMMHSYGAGRIFASVHVEINADTDLMVSHDLMDRIEREVHRQFRVLLVVHSDPLIADDGKINRLHSMVSGAVLSIDPDFSIHDFRVVEGPTHTNLIFDVLVPHRYVMKDSEIVARITQKVKQQDERYFCVITVDKTFVPHV